MTQRAAVVSLSQNSAFMSYSLVIFFARYAPQTCILCPQKVVEGADWMVQAQEEGNFPPSPTPEKYDGHPHFSSKKLPRRGSFEGWKGVLPKSAYT